MIAHQQRRESRQNPRREYYSSTSILIVLSVCLFYFSAPTRPRAPTTRPDPPLAAVIYAPPPPQPGTPPATVWAPGRPPPSWGVHAQQNGTLGNRARPSTQRVHLGSRKTRFSVGRTQGRPSATSFRSILPRAKGPGSASTCIAGRCYSPRITSVVIGKAGCCGTYLAGCAPPQTSHAFAAQHAMAPSCSQ